MGALIGIAIQLAVMAVGLTITLLIWTMRLMLMLVGAVIAAGRLALGLRHHRSSTP